MKKFLIILTAVFSMVAVSACSSAGNGSGSVSDHTTQTAQKGHAAEPPGGAMPPPVRYGEKNGGVLYRLSKRLL